jgi:hypothetical protein
LSNLCWCGRPPEEHDGRELDEKGDLHRFNEAARPPEVWEDHDDDYPREGAALPPPLTSGLLWKIKKFLDRQILTMARNGMKFPEPLLTAATQISSELGTLLDSPGIDFGPDDRQAAAYPKKKPLDFQWPPHLADPLEYPRRHQLVRGEEGA